MRGEEPLARIVSRETFFDPSRSRESRGERAATGMFHVKHSREWDDVLAEFRARTSELALTLTDHQVQRVGVGARSLAKVAVASGMSGYETPQQALERGMAPALAYFGFAQAPRSGRLADLGAGTGALGVTIAVVAPELRVDLIDRAERAFTACELLVARMQLRNLRARLLDTERGGKSEPGYDAVVFRALAPGATALEMAGHLLLPGGFLAAWHRECDPHFAQPPAQFKALGSVQSGLEGLVATGYGFYPQ